MAAIVGIIVTAYSSVLLVFFEESGMRALLRGENWRANVEVTEATCREAGEEAGILEQVSPDHIQSDGQRAQT